MFNHELGQLYLVRTLLEQRHDILIFKHSEMVDIIIRLFLTHFNVPCQQRFENLGVVRGLLAHATFPIPENQKESTSIDDEDGTSVTVTDYPFGLPPQIYLYGSCQTRSDYSNTAALKCITSTVRAPLITPDGFNMGLCLGKRDMCYRSAII